MTEQNHRRWDITIKAAAVVVTLAGVWAGYRQFIDEFELSNRKPFIELRTNSYVQLVQTVSKIAYPENPAEREKEKVHFWQLYVGLSAMVEDPTIEDVVNDLSECIRKLDESCDQSDLEALSTRLSSEARLSLLRSWRIEKAEDL